MKRKNINNKFECPEGFEKCKVIELLNKGFKESKSARSYPERDNEFTLARVGENKHLIFSRPEDDGKVTCYNPQLCIDKYSKNEIFSKGQAKYILENKLLTDFVLERNPGFFCGVED